MTDIDMSIALPPLGRINLGIVWAEAILYGINCVIFTATVYVLLKRRKSINRPLLATSCFLFLLSSSDAVLGFLTLYRPLTDPAVVGVPEGWDLYYLKVSKISFARSQIYCVVVVTQNLLLIWRLYVVWGKRMIIALPAMLFECVHAASSFVATHFLLTSEPFSRSVQVWGKATLALDIFVNTSVTCAICGRLWWVSRKNVIGKRMSYGATMFTMIESGAIFAGSTLICFILELAGSVGGIQGTQLLTQLATFTPLFIIVRVGLGLTHGRNGTKSVTTIPRSRPIALVPRILNVGMMEAGECDEQQYPAVGHLMQSTKGQLSSAEIV